jgi:hypothetical protein
MSTISGGRGATVAFVLGTSASQSSTVQIPAPAPWFANVQRRLRNSVGVPAQGGPDGRWLSGDVVNAANTFFLATSDMLPAEPHLESSQKGDLIAEFSGSYGAMTMIVSNAYATAFAMLGGQPVQRRISLDGAQPETLRAELSKITNALREQASGTMDAKG